MLLLHRDLERMELQGNRLDCSSFELPLKVPLLRLKLLVLHISETRWGLYTPVAHHWRPLTHGARVRAPMAPAPCPKAHGRDDRPRLGVCQSPTPAGNVPGQTSALCMACQRRCLRVTLVMKLMGA